MDPSLDVDEQLELWKYELEKDGARLDIMPPPLARPADTRIIGVSLKGMLADLVRQLPAFDPRFDTWYRYGGFFSHVRVYVPDSAVPVKLHEEFSSSVREFRTAEEAEEKASEGMIRTLEKNYNFEVKDLNWWDKRQFHFNSYNSCTGWRRAEEENQAFKMKVEALTSGWRRTLEGLDRWHLTLGWADVEPDTPVKAGARFCICYKELIPCVMFPLRIAYVTDENGGSSACKKGGVFAFGSGSLLAGEERFSVQLDEEEQVWYEVLSFSKLSALCYPYVQFRQRHFESAKAMLRHLAGSPTLMQAQ